MRVACLVKLVECRLVPKEVLAGTEFPGGGGRRRLYLTLHCHHQSDSCIKMGSDESRFNVSLMNYCEGQSHKNSVYRP